MAPILEDAAQRMAPILEDAVQRTAQRRSFAKMKSITVSGQQFAHKSPDRVRSDFTAKALQEAPIGAVLISGSGTVFSMNNYALNTLNMSEKEVLDVALSSLFPEQAQSEMTSFLQDGHISGEKHVIEINETETVKYLELSAAPIDMESSSNFKLVVLDDITDSVVARQRTQAHLEELEKLNSNLSRVNADLDIFIYTASHDLKSPILNIEGLVSSLESELGAESAKVEMELEHIKRSIERFKQTVEDLTEVSRIQRSFEQEADQVNFGAIVDEVTQLLEREISESGASIKIITGAQPTLRFPKKNLTSVIYNLVSNAIKYRSPSRKPCIEIDAWQEAGDFCFTLKDNGLGIPESKRERVFQLFKRMHSHVAGSGVGLYIVKRIVENNGGSITVESEEGTGTLFKLRLKEYAAQ
ncbi:ATP-binding protein [Pontibacter silvestris]|uniref:histidine kinase n=1 Tax=Pontibacter silvestris TaxID=2305183 RepID=A0ABW4WZ54_9BACT|nr:PAS domain-containing sensor histidine kinase [Pontibacter silvestris]MCC9138956.1 PAS domain-containing sensor histidine kinase [Pontibacter silvestris]